MGTAVEKYDRQLILMFEPDDNIRALRKAIVDKNPGLQTDIAWTKNGKPEHSEIWHALVSVLTKDSRLYLLGHGNWRNESLGGMMPGEIPSLLKKLTAVKLISCAGCASARTEADDKRISLSNQSFVTRLHKLLGEDTDGPKLKTVMFGRVFKVAAEAGQTYKMTGDTVGDLRHHRAASKVRLYWEGDKQKVEWVEYTNAIDDEDSVGRSGVIPKGGAYLST